ncbi:DHH family phosphoesterase [Lachnospiraceae bacterium 47-T17]
MKSAQPFVKMIDFYEKLETLGLNDILFEIDYERPNFRGLPKVLSFLTEAITSDKKVLIYGDYDVDGLMCNLTISEGLQNCGLQHYDIFQYHSRMHELDKIAVQQCLQGDYDYFVVGDTGFGESDLSKIRLLADADVKVVILDHHNTLYAYEDLPENVAAINTTVENVPAALSLSAGALCFVVMDALAEKMNIKFKENLAAYATISLFADCMDMRSKLNRAIYFRARKLEREELPRKVKLFMNKYSAFNARFIGFWFSPRINAVFRCEHLQLLNVLFLQKNIMVTTETETLEQINNVYEESRELVGKVVDIVDTTIMNHFVVANLNSVNNYINIKKNKLYNYTGLVANQLSDRYERTAVVICLSDNFYKGSVRDLYGRNYLAIFRKICFAGGHNAAFGIRVGVFEKNNFIESIHRIDQLFAIERIENKPIIIDYEYNSIDPALIEDIAMYNEFPGPSVPLVLLRKRIIGGIREEHSNYNFKYNWDGYTIQSNRRLDFGTKVLLKPIKSWKTKLLVQ